MSALRQKMIRELELRRMAPRTITQYVSAVRHLADYYHRSPDRISNEEVRQYIHYMLTERKLSYSACNVALAGIRFLYCHVVGIHDFDLRVPSKRSGRLPEPLSRQEVARLIQGTPNRKHRVLMMTAYGAGLRVSELVRLQLTDIQSERMAIRVNQGKGRKDRYTLLSPRLLEELRRYWLEYRPEFWLFPSPQDNSRPISADSVKKTFMRMKKRAKIQHGSGIHCLRHSFATHLLEGGVSLTVIQQLLGHKSLATTSVYLHVTSQHVADIQSPLELLRLPKAVDVQA